LLIVSKNNQIKLNMTLTKHNKRRKEMTHTQQKFNAVQYKQTTREQWNSAAEAWHRWAPLLSRWLGPATETMLDMCGVTNGSRVLDVAAGAGEQTLTVAKRIGETGHVLATDISPNILEFAHTSAKLAGFNNVRTQVLDGENLTELEADPFDAVISRVGLIYFPDQQKALHGMKQQLRNDGKVAAMVYSTAERNPFFSIPVSIIRRRANLPAPLPGQPGPFSLGGEGSLEKAFADAGFRNIEVKTINAPVRLTSAAECLQFEQESFGALHQMLSGLSDAEQDEAWNEIEEALGQFETNGQFEGPCEIMVAVGAK
jgi:ubiquinone/menaquinone biosynthesis C-methylase UbiE